MFENFSRPGGSFEDRTGDEVDSELAGDFPRPLHGRTVERLRPRSHLLGCPEHRPLLRQHNELGALPGGLTRQAVRSGKVAIYVVGRVELYGGGAHRSD